VIGFWHRLVHSHSKSSLYMKNNSSPLKGRFTEMVEKQAKSRAETAGRMKYKQTHRKRTIFYCGSGFCTK
jgi:hypothetical protein